MRREGLLRQLLDAADDCFVIMGHGEELTLRFAADAFGPDGNPQLGLPAGTDMIIVVDLLGVYGQATG